jgi:putative transposase
VARKVRIEFPGAAYHVMSRGDHQEDVFRDDQDRIRFLETLGEACGQTGWRVHAYVLMGNHYHLLLETPEPNLSLGMKWLQGTYTQRFNSRHRVFGHLFQGRYKALNVDDDSEYFETVSTYIHLNPVRAGLVQAEEKALAGYRWSSYLGYVAAPSRRPTWLETGRVLHRVGIVRDNASGRRRYAAWMDLAVVECGERTVQELEERWRNIHTGWYLGGETFKERLLDWIEERVTAPMEASDRGKRQSHDERAAERIVKECMKKLELGNTEMRKLAKGAPEKLVMAWRLRQVTTVSRQWVADRLYMGHVTRVTMAVSEVRSAKGGQIAKYRRLLKVSDSG